MIQDALKIKKWEFGSFPGPFGIPEGALIEKKMPFHEKPSNESKVGSGERISSKQKGWLSEEKLSVY